MSRIVYQDFFNSFTSRDFVVEARVLDGTFFPKNDEEDGDSDVGSDVSDDHDGGREGVRTAAAKRQHIHVGMVGRAKMMSRCTAPSVCLITYCFRRR